MAQIDTLLIEQRALKLKLDMERKVQQHREERQARAQQQEALEKSRNETSLSLNNAAVEDVTHMFVGEFQETCEVDELEAFLLNN